MKAPTGLLLLLVAGISAVGCHQPAAPVTPTQQTVLISDYDGFIDNTLTALRERSLDPAAVDRRAGQIVTERATGAQWFEFWRSDVQGAYQAFESNIQTIGRVVTVSIDPVAATTQPATQPTTAATTQPIDDAAYRVTVRVDKSRFHTPPRQVTTSSGALAIYSDRLPTERGLRGRASRQTETWVPLGRDGLLEEYLLDQFLRSPAVAALLD